MQPMVLSVPASAFTVLLPMDLSPDPFAVRAYRYSASFRQSRLGSTEQRFRFGTTVLAGKIRHVQHVNKLLPFRGAVNPFYGIFFYAAGAGEVAAFSLIGPG